MLHSLTYTQAHIHTRTNASQRQTKVSVTSPCGNRPNSLTHCTIHLNDLKWPTPRWPQVDRKLSRTDRLGWSRLTMACGCVRNSVIRWRSWKHRSWCVILRWFIWAAGSTCRTDCQYVSYKLNSPYLSKITMKMERNDVFRWNHLLS